MPVKFDDAKVKRMLNSLVNKLHSQKLMNLLGLMAERFIQKRTREGKDVSGSPWAAYSEPYKKKREKVGLSTHPVNLMWDEYTGMMRHIDHLVARTFDKVLIYINDPHKRKLAYYHDKSGAGKSRVVRHFFGISDTEKKQINDRANAAVADIIRGLNNG